MIGINRTELKRQYEEAMERAERMMVAADEAIAYGADADKYISAGLAHIALAREIRKNHNEVRG